MKIRFELPPLFTRFYAFTGPIWRLKGNLGFAHEGSRVAIRQQIILERFHALEWRKMDV